MDGGEETLGTNQRIGGRKPETKDHQHASQGIDHEHHGRSLLHNHPVTIKGTWIMKEYQKRVVEEKTELDNKLVKLNNFIESDRFEDVDEEEQERLTRQGIAMQDYSLILEERIAAFDEDDSDELEDEDN